MSTFLSLVVFSAGMAVSAAAEGGGVPYGIGDWPESLGNHRAVLRVDKADEAAHVLIPWRRTDEQPEQKDIQVVAAGETKPVANRVVLQCSRECGEVLFQAKQPGEYHVYYMPYRPKRQLGFGSETYTKPKDTADAQWMKRARETFEKSPDRLGRAEVVEIQARGEWNRFDPMEVPATQAETEALLAQCSQSTFLLFPEDRTNPIRMKDALPLKWIRQGAQSEFRGEASATSTSLFNWDCSPRAKT